MSKNYTRKSAEERKAEVDQLSQTLIDHVSAEVSSGNIQEILDNIARVSYDYSLNNVLLIGMQRPDATTVASYTKWKSVNRQVSAGEKGIAIICPVPYKYKAEVPIEDPATHTHIRDGDGNIVTEEKVLDGMSFRLGYVFDISQTAQIEGKETIPLEVVQNLNGSIGENYNDLLYAARTASPVPTEIGEIKSAANGYFSHNEQKIVVKNEMSEEQTLKTTIHEVAHSILHNEELHNAGGLTYYVASSGDIPTLGEYHDQLSLTEAVKAYKDIPDDRLHGGKVIGIELDTPEYGRTAFNIVRDNEILIRSVSDVQFLKENLEVQQALNDLQIHFHPDDFSLPTMREVQAESTAYLVAAHYGIDTSEYSIRYVTAWADMEPATVMDNLDAVRSCANEIIDRMDSVLEKLSEERQMNEPMSAMDLAQQIDEYVKTYGDYYDYLDGERYSGSHFDDLLSEIRHGQTDGIKGYLSEMIAEYPGTVESVKAETLLERMDRFEQDNLSNTESLHMTGMKM